MPLDVRAESQILIEKFVSDLTALMRAEFESLLPDIALSEIAFPEDLFAAPKPPIESNAWIDPAGTDRERIISYVAARAELERVTSSAIARALQLQDAQVRQLLLALVRERKLVIIGEGGLPRIRLAA